jgi:isoleucyl-tRNA synthetase
MRKPGRGFPTDLYLEGSDQHRGWFQLSLLPSLAATGHSPFRGVLTHGFVVDRDGRKMSKSVGNTIDVEDLLKDYGADVCRWWVSTLAFENDIKVDMSYFDLASETYRKVRNTLRFLLGNLQDFDPETATGAVEAPPTSLDVYVLDRARRLGAEVGAAYEAYTFRKTNQLLYDFCNDTLSAFYCAAVKDRLYCDRADSPRRRLTQRVMWDTLEVLCRLLSPILPHTADEVYRAMRGPDACAILVPPFEIAPVPVADDWTHVLEVRERALKALEEAKGRGVENPLDAGVVLGDADGRLAPFKGELAEMLGVSQVQLRPEDAEVEVLDLRGEARCDRCWRRDPTTQEAQGNGPGGMLCERCRDAVR